MIYVELTSTLTPTYTVIVCLYIVFHIRALQYNILNTYFCPRYWMLWSIKGKQLWYSQTPFTTKQCTRYTTKLRECCWIKTFEPCQNSLVMLYVSSVMQLFWACLRFKGLCEKQYLHKNQLHQIMDMFGIFVFCCPKKCKLFELLIEYMRVYQGKEYQ